MAGSDVAVRGVEAGAPGGVVATEAPSAKASKKKRSPGLTLPSLGGLPLPASHAYAGAVLSGLLYWLAFPGMDVWPLSLVTWVPLLVAMHRQTARRAATLGWVTGTVMNVAGFFWLQTMLQTFSGFPAPICFLFVFLVCAYQGGRVGLLGWLYARASARGWPAAVVLVAAFVASELLYPLLFPWYYAATVHQVPALVQTVDLGGPILAGGVLIAANLAIAEPLLARLERRRLDQRVIGVSAAVVVLACVYGIVRVRGVDAEAQAAPQSTVGVVQADMGLLEKRTDMDEGVQRHLALSAEARAKHADFLVWSETSAMHAVSNESYRDELRSLARRVGLPTIFGSVIVKRVPDDRRYVLYNSAVVSNADGVIGGRYDKQYLLTFGEYLPFGDTFPILYKWSPNSGHFTPGKTLDPLVLDVDGHPHSVTVLICYEDILPEFANAAVRQGDPDLLVNMTNDAWFGDTAEPWEHLALAQLRAAEHHRYFVRGTNSGVSAVIDPVGRVVAHSGTFRQEALVTPIRWMRARTVYEALGDWPWLIVSVGAVAGAFRRRRSTAGTVTAVRSAAS